MSDPINPKHYKHLPAEAIDIIMAAIAKAPSNESAYLQGQVLKYLLRCWEKKGIEDLRKAKWYLDRMVASFDDLLAEASGANETPGDEPSQPAERPKDFIENFFGGVAEILGQSPPKRFYREPTMEDLKNGPIDCEVRDCDIQAWRKAKLQTIYLGAAYEFQVQKHGSLRENRYAQCRIEVT